MSNTSKIRLRLKLNFRTEEVQFDRIRTFANLMVEDVAVEASDKMWKMVQERIAGRIERDVTAEIRKMAEMYNQLVVGISPTRGGMDGTLTPRSKFADGMENPTYKILGPARRWAPRGQAGVGRQRRFGDYYLPWKQRHVHHQRWFDHTGLLAREMGKASNWTAWFGPVSVSVKRTDTQTLADANRTAMSQDTRDLQQAYKKRLYIGGRQRSGAELKVNVANIRVEAMRNITPEMLPALVNGNINDMPADGRSTGLIKLLPPVVQWHIAGSSKYVPYRHTLEPFLGFVLTRAIPNALMRRIEDGLPGSIRYLGANNRRQAFTNPLDASHSEGFKG